MGRKLKDEEFTDPDFQALFLALEKAGKPVAVTVAERKGAIAGQRKSGQAAKSEYGSKVPPPPSDEQHTS